VAKLKKPTIGGKRLHPESLMMSYGYRPEWSEGSIKCPIFQTSTFAFESAQAGKDFFELALGMREKGIGEEAGLIYSRLNNPDLEVLEDRLTLWDSAEKCAVFASGMAAIATTLLERLGPGDVLFHSEPVYGGTDYFIKHVLPRFGIVPVGFPAGAGAREVEAALRTAVAKRPLGMIFIETPANPTNALVDIEACAALAGKYSPRDRRALLAVDNTFLGPLWQHPLRHGADLVIYSATKYIGGHADVIAGVCLGGADVVEPIRAMRTFMGTMCSPLTGWLLLRSLETLKLRMTAEMKNARYVADFLANHAKVERVYFLDLLTEEDAQFEVYKKQCLAPGAVVSFDIRGGREEAYRLLDALQLFTLAVSLGGTESLAEHPATMTHADVAPGEREGMGITDRMVRMSIGVENPEDLIADLEQALEKA
jgi:methionine-gamma-lyase